MFDLDVVLLGGCGYVGLPLGIVLADAGDRECGVSRSRVIRWLPRYLRWYFHAFGPKIPASQTNV